MGYYYSLMVITMVIYQFSWCHILYTTCLRPWNACRRPPSWNARPTRGTASPRDAEKWRPPKLLIQWMGLGENLSRKHQMIKIQIYWRKSTFSILKSSIHVLNPCC